MQRGGSLTQTAYGLLSDLRHDRARHAAIAARQRGDVVAFDNLVAEDRDRDRPPSPRDQLVVRALVFIDVMGRERQALS